MYRKKESAIEKKRGHAKKNRPGSGPLALGRRRGLCGGLIFTNAAILCQPGFSIVSAQDARGAECILVLGARVDGDAPS
jgi:hypothetical protein